MNNVNERNTIAIKFPDSMTKLPPFDNYLTYQRYQNREIYLNDVVDDWVIDDIVSAIYEYNSADTDIPVEERKVIKIYVNTNGGAIDSCMALLGAMRTSKTPIHTIVQGKAYSAGSLILLAGHHRVAYQESVILIHEGYMGFSNASSKARDYVEFTERQEEKIKQFILSKTKITSEQYDEKYRKEWYMLAEDALALGIVDEII
jgi:ATP-dependent Clp protease protease subunit